MSITEKLKKGAGWALGQLAPIQNNKIIVSSFYGRGYSDNPKAIVDELLRRKLPLDIVWVAKNPARAGVPGGVRTVRYGSPEAMRELATARVWLDNCRKGAPGKRRGQYYMQTWHGLALKRIERDVADKLNPSDGADYAKYAERDSGQIDVIVSNCAFMTKIYKNSFWYDGAVEAFGSPRNDILVNPPARAREEVGRALGLPEDAKLLLYAPTFRADGSLDAYGLDYAAACAACERRFGGHWIALVRLHPNVMQKAKTLKFDNRLTFDATAFDDMQLLLAACDAVITDYSSLMFDFALTRRPCFQFATDIADYQNDRNFYFPIDQTPFPLATDNAALARCIERFDEAVYLRGWDAFYRKFGLCEDGHAAERCADWILARMM